MATYIDIDSRHRNWNTYPNPAYFTIEPEQVQSWNKAPRQVTATSSRPGARVVEFSQSVQLKALTIPFIDAGYYVNGAIVNSHTASFQRIYVDVHTSRYDDKQLINTIDNKIPKARFVCTQEGYQSDAAGTPTLIRFSSRMDQVMRFARNEAIVFELMQEDGHRIWLNDTPQNAPPTAPTSINQVWALLEVTPYIRDGDFYNHNVGLTQF